MKYYLLLLIMASSYCFPMDHVFANETEEKLYAQTRKLIQWAKDQKFNMQEFLAQSCDKDEDHYTLLHMAVDELSHPVVELLLNAGADVNGACGKYLNKTPLAIAIKKISEYPNAAFKMVELLCSYGAQPNSQLRHQLLYLRMIYAPKNSDYYSKCLKLLSDQQSTRKIL